MVRRRDVIVGLSALPAVQLAGGALAAATAQEDAEDEAAGESAPQEQVMEGDTVETSQGNLVIHPVAHASLLLAWGGHVLYVDPVGGAEPYADLPAPTGILITHEHGDHFDLPTLEAVAGQAPLIVNEAVYNMLPEALKGRATALANGDTGSVSGIQVRAVPAYNTTPERQQYHPQGRDNGYILTFADKLVYVAGDTEDTEEMRALSGIEVAFIPMNLPYTMDVEQAADAVNAFQPAIVYPYHYRGSDLDAFEELVQPLIEVRRGAWYPEGEG
jgi:Predicted Zn-dependent hydrolases of the beta-lactamase fold